MQTTQRLLSLLALASVLNCSLFAQGAPVEPVAAEAAAQLPDQAPVAPAKMSEAELIHFLGFLTAQSGGVSTLNLDEAGIAAIVGGLTKALKGELTTENVEQAVVQAAFAQAQARATAIESKAAEIPEMTADALEKIGFVIVMQSGLTQLGFGAEDTDAISAGFQEGAAAGAVDPKTLEAKMLTFEAFIQARVQVAQAKALAEQQAATAAARAEFVTIEDEWKVKEPMTVVLETTQGAVEVKLMPQYAPIAVANFVGHIENGYYDGLIFHRVIKDFMVQGGDPQGTGMGGESIWGKPFPDEFTQDVRFDKVGLLAMANSGPMTNGSQFFITTSMPNWLNDKHTIFGEVTVGYDLVEKISLLETAEQDRPVQEQKIIKAYVKKG